MKENLPWILICLLLLLIATLVCALWEPATSGDTLERELVKFLMQLGLVIIVGGAIAAWWKYYWEEEARARDRLRQSAAERSALYREFITRVGSAYREAKAVRRILRASGFGPRAETSDPALKGSLNAVYREQMLGLNQVQLQLEELKIEAKHHPELRERPRIYECLKSMEQYLGELIKEFEWVRGQPVELDDLRSLGEFTARSKENVPGAERRFKSHFSTAHGEIVRLLASLI